MFVILGWAVPLTDFMGGGVSNLCAVVMPGGHLWERNRSVAGSEPLTRTTY